MQIDNCIHDLIENAKSKEHNLAIKTANAESCTEKLSPSHKNLWNDQGHLHEALLDTRAQE
jgi:hypothetical protein